jgi:hypothetical protein
MQLSNQLRCNGLIVNDVPRQFDGKHVIFHPEADLEIPLRMTSSFSFFETHRPSDDDLENLIRVELTSDTDWLSLKETLHENEPYHMFHHFKQVQLPQSPLSTNKYSCPSHLSVLLS